MNPPSDPELPLWRKMMNRPVHHVALLLLAAVVIGFVGCGPSSSTKPASNVAKHDDHEHERGHKEGKHGDEAGHKEHHPDTYAEAVKEIDELRTTVKNALAKDDTEKADKPLHEVGHILEDVVALAQKASLDAAKQDEIKKAVEQLFDSFGKVDEKIHGRKGSTYEEESQKIDAAMATLRQYVPGGK
jgi:hypothetical protein